MRLGGRHNMPPPHLDFWPFDLGVGVGVTCDLGYPCAKFRLPRPFGFRVRADVRDIRQTDGRRTPITALCPLGGGMIKPCWCNWIETKTVKIPTGSLLTRTPDLLFRVRVRVKMALFAKQHDVFPPIYRCNYRNANHGQRQFWTSVFNIHTLFLGCCNVYW